VRLAGRPSPAPNSRGTGEGTLLFGGSGFLGPYILERLPGAISVGRNPAPTSNRHIQVDSLEDLSALRDVEFDKVVYIIGNTDHHNMEKEHLPLGEETAFDYHVMPLHRTMEQLKHYPIKKFLHFSTVLLYDERRITLPVDEHAPIDPYRNRYVLSKYLAEEACKFYARWLPIINIRMCNLYGPTPLERYDLIHVLSKQLLATGRGEVWSTTPERDFIYVDDAVDGVLGLLDADYTGTVNLGTGTTTSVRTVVDILERVSGCPIEDLGRPVDGPPRFRCDTSTLERLIGWSPRVSIEEGVRRTYEAMAAWAR
jgi:nucleoside-diphosphate-sugar epimerase